VSNPRLTIKSPLVTFLHSLQSALVRVVDTVSCWREATIQRRALLALDDRLLRDIGMSRADAVREAKRPFWDQRPAATGDMSPFARTHRPAVASAICCQR
jgi:uncharacterized protein YjiS (DUF1127 family)